jgi:GDP-L-fucose synthase
MTLAGANVLVAGGSGFIGTNLARRLVNEGAKVRATTFSHPMKIDDGDIEVMQADLRRVEDCEKAVAGMDYVFMCAACTSGAAVMRTNPLAHVTPNVVMNAFITEAAYKAGVRKFLFISSGAAYPPTDDRPVTEDEMFEGDPYEAYYSVGWMKRYAEVLCRIYAEKIPKPMSTVVVRPSNVYGPYDKFDYETSHVTAALVRRVVERVNPMDIWGTGEDIRDLIYIDDFMDGVLAAFAVEDQYLAINICSGQGHSVKEILATALKVDGYNDADIRFDPSKPSTIPVRLMDGALAKSQLGFEPRISLEEGLRRTLEWYRANPAVGQEG